MTGPRLVASPSRSASDWLCNLAANRRGNVAMMFALMLPVMLVTGLGGIELNQVVADKKRTQDVADAAALMGATQFAITPTGADTRAQAYAQSQLTDVAVYATVNVQAAISQNNTVMTVAVDTQRASFFGNLLPLGGFHTHVVSSAKAVNSTPLCVLAFGTGASAQFSVGTLNIMQAANCLLHSEQAINVQLGGIVYAASAEAVTTASGIILPSGGESSAPPLAPPKDPFSTLNVQAPAACPANAPATTVNLGQTVTLDSYETNPAKAFHGAVTVNPGGTLILSSGEHYFCGPLALNGIAVLAGVLKGSDVALVFEPGSSMNLNSLGTVSLSGRLSGPLAGFVLVVDRACTSDFHIQGAAVQNLTGTVYVPSAKLVIDGSPNVLMLASSPWTVITAKAFELQGGGTLSVNANYAQSLVPVPNGVGNTRNNVELTP